MIKFIQTAQCILKAIFTHIYDLPVSQVEPLFSRQLLYYAQQMGAHYYRSYDHAGVSDHINASEEYQRAIAHHHSGSLQEWPQLAAVTVETWRCCGDALTQQEVVPGQCWMVDILSQCAWLEPLLIFLNRWLTISYLGLAWALESRGC